MEKNKRLAYSYAFGAVFLLLGILFNYHNIGRADFGFGTMGNWLMYIGFVAVMAATLRTFKKKEKLVDERVHFIAAKANRITFLVIIIGAFVVMVIDGIRPITAPYHLFMSYMVCAILAVYSGAYLVLSKYF